MGGFFTILLPALALSKNDPRIPTFKAAWVRGYRLVRGFSAEDEAEIETFIMFRRMALLARIGSHIQAPEPQQTAPKFVSITGQIGKLYLKRHQKC
jgi:Ser/Thr protein kinase RdoA (MazF antagonist)